MQAKLSITNLTLIKFACILNLAISLLPIVDYYCPWFVTAVPILIILFVTISMNTNIYPLLPAMALIFCFAFLEYWIVQRSTAFIGYFINFIIAFIPCMMAIQLSKNISRKEFFLDYLKFVAILIGITSITTIIGLNLFPMASRELASGTAVYDTTIYTKMNIGGYDFIYSLVLFIPILFWLIKNTSNAWKFVYIAVLVANLWCIYESQYTIALLCAVGALLILWFQLNKRIGFIAICAFVVFLLLNGFSLLGELFRWASEVINQEYVADRLLQLSQLFSGKTVNTSTSNERLEHYFNQFVAFKESPIWGHNLISYSKEKISGHSLILDILGGAGIIGGILLTIILRILYVLTINPHKKALSPYINSVWVILFVIACLNPVVFPMVTTIAFMCCTCIQQVEKPSA